MFCLRLYTRASDYYASRVPTFLPNLIHIDLWEDGRKDQFPNQNRFHTAVPVSWDKYCYYVIQLGTRDKQNGRYGQPNYVDWLLWQVSNLLPQLELNYFWRSIDIGINSCLGRNVLLIPAWRCRSCRSYEFCKENVCPYATLGHFERNHFRNRW